MERMRYVIKPVSEQLIPNAVGRLDDVVEAIRDGRIDDAIGLLVERRRDVLIKKETFQEEVEKAKEEFYAINGFLKRIANDSDFAERVRVACGVGAEVKGDE